MPHLNIATSYEHSGITFQLCDRGHIQTTADKLCNWERSTKEEWLLGILSEATWPERIRDNGLQLLLPTQPHEKELSINTEITKQPWDIGEAM